MEFEQLVGVFTSSEFALAGKPLQRSESATTVPHYDFTISLTTLYCALCTFTLVQLIRTICYRHNLTSFRSGFLTLGFIWTFCRLFFWLVVNVEKWPLWLSTVIYFLPSACNVGISSMIILYYAHGVIQGRYVHTEPSMNVRTSIVSDSFCLVHFHPYLSPHTLCPLLLCIFVFST